MDLLCGLVRVYSTMVSAASLKVMNFYDDMGRFKFLLAVLFVNFIVVVVLCSCICYKNGLSFLY